MLTLLKKINIFTQFVDSRFVLLAISLCHQISTSVEGGTIPSIVPSTWVDLFFAVCLFQVFMVANSLRCCVANYIYTVLRPGESTGSVFLHTNCLKRKPRKSALSLQFCCWKYISYPV